MGVEVFETFYPNLEKYKVVQIFFKNLLCTTMISEGILGESIRLIEFTMKFGGQKLAQTYLHVSRVCHHRSF